MKMPLRKWWDVFSFSEDELHIVPVRHKIFLTRLSFVALTDAWNILDK